MTILFSVDSLTLKCRDYDTYRYTVTLTDYGSKELGSDSSPKLSLSLLSELYIHIITLPEDGEPTYQIYVGRRPTVPTIRRHKLSLTDTDCVCVKFRWLQHFNCHASFPASFATELHEEAYWKHLPALFFIFTAAFRVFEVILQLSYTCVKSFSRGGKQYSGKHRAWNFHQ